MPVIFSDPRVRLSRREGGRSHSLEAGVLGLKATERHCLRFEIRLGRWQCAERRLNHARLGRHHSLCHGASAFSRQRVRSGRIRGTALVARLLERGGQ